MSRPCSITIAQYYEAGFAQVTPAQLEKEKEYVRLCHTVNRISNFGGGGAHNVYTIEKLFDIYDSFGLEFEPFGPPHAGYDMGSWTPFVTGGIAWASTRYSRTDLTTGNEDASPSNTRVGWTTGGGLDYRLDPRWTTRLEYLYTNLGLTGLQFASAPARYDSQYNLHQFRVGLNYKFGGWWY